jgi:hypothetical protein
MAAATSAVATQYIGVSAAAGYSTTPSTATRPADHGPLRFSR